MSSARRKGLFFSLSLSLFHSLSLSLFFPPLWLSPREHNVRRARERQEVQGWGSNHMVQDDCNLGALKRPALLSAAWRRKSSSSLRVVSILLLLLQPLLLIFFSSFVLKSQRTAVNDFNLQCFMPHHLAISLTLPSLPCLRNVCVCVCVCVCVYADIYIV